MNKYTIIYFYIFKLSKSKTHIPTFFVFKVVDRTLQIKYFNSNLVHILNKFNNS